MTDKQTTCISACAEKGRLGIRHGLCAVCVDELHARWLVQVRRAWEAGFALCRSYGDNHAHFGGEQKERHWQALLTGDSRNMWEMAAAMIKVEMPEADQDLLTWPPKR